MYNLPEALLFVLLIKYIMPNFIAYLFSAFRNKSKCQQNPVEACTAQERAYSTYGIGSHLSIHQYKQQLGGKNLTGLGTIHLKWNIEC